MVTDRRADNRDHSPIGPQSRRREIVTRRLEPLVEETGDGEIDRVGDLADVAADLTGEPAFPLVYVLPE